jgi:hypothetical protein
MTTLAARARRRNGLRVGGCRASIGGNEHARHRRMIDRKLVEALRARAAADAAALLRDSPSAPPNEKWIDNSFTAALPLAKDEARTDFDTAETPELFRIYKSEIERVFGPAREDKESDRREHAYEQIQEPTAGEH